MQKTTETSDSPWSSSEMVARLSTSPPNAVLIQFAKEEQLRSSGPRLLDIGCGAGCNAVPLARMGWKVLGLDLSKPMLEAATHRAKKGNLTKNLRFETASMERLPVKDQCFDFIVAHGIWNLARSATEFRMALQEAARAARTGAPLFVYTFSRNTFPPNTTPVEGESFVFTEFSGKPQCFLTKQQLIDELAAAGFEQETGNLISEYERLPNGKPAIHEGIFHRKRPTKDTNR